MSRASDVMGASAPIWLSGKTYRPGDLVKAPADLHQLYVRTGAQGSGGADPSADPGNYTPFGMRAIKSIQRGVISAGSATIAAVNTAKAELRYLGTAGNWSSGDTSQSGAATGYVVLASATTITKAQSPLNAATTTVSWELTEYF